MINQQGISDGHAGKFQKPSLTHHPAEVYHSLADAKARRYDFTIGGLFSEAWRLTKGFKMDFFLGFLLYSVIGSAVMTALVVLLSMIFFGIMLSYSGSMDIVSFADLEYALAYDPGMMGRLILIYLIYFVLMILVSIPLNVLSMGLLVMAQKRGNGVKVDIVADLFAPFKVFWKLFFLQIVIGLIYIVGIFLFVLPGIYVAIASCLTFFIIFAYPNSTVFEIIFSSWKMVNQHFFKIFGMLILLFFINFIAMIPFGIGLIWSMPFSYLVLAVLLREITKVSEPAPKLSIPGF